MLPTVGNPFDDAAPARTFAVDHYASLRGLVRTRNVDRQLARHLPPSSARVVDVGGGSGEQSVLLARRGHDVVVVEPSAEMRDQARRRLAAEPPEVRDRCRLVDADLDGARAALGDARFDVVLCHGVLMYLEDPEMAVRSLVELAAPGGLVSVVATNRDALALRSGLRGRWSEALEHFDASCYVNGIGIEARADQPEELADRLRRHGSDPVAWYGVRLFTDAWTPDWPADDDPEGVLAVEWEAATRDPYRRLSRLFHLVARSR